ncbi:hypothetical protein OG194_12250 [Streptomyces sp. NBC_01288]|uniref:hypothetical protein n=1 Tax=Streptomyces sp. NBC_01288 TaxID=2903814 RepID=UPI002E151B31|nr:hypothetical protein OG194_12250 [Streptomyces sp. NBC_01288]
METSQTSRTQPPIWPSVKAAILILSVIGLFCGAGWTFLNKGLYLLPNKMCDGTLERDTVKQVLPKARSADSGFGSQGAGYNLTFSCHVTTSNDSILSGTAQVEPVSRDQWLKHFRGTGKQNQLIRVSVGKIEALAQIDSSENTSSVYVPCAPRSVPSYNSSQPYAVVGETWISNPAHTKSIPLRQTLTDFAYQLAQHTYKLGECKEPRDFPKELPRYGSD